MTVTPRMISLVSPYTVGEDGDFDYDDFETYKDWAQAELDMDDPGLTTSKYDEAHALLICDIYESSRGKVQFKSEKIGDYSYTKEERAAIKTPFRIRYEQIIALIGAEQSTEGQERIEYDPEHETGTDQAFLLDNNKQIGFEEDWEDV